MVKFVHLQQATAYATNAQKKYYSFGKTSTVRTLNLSVSGFDLLKLLYPTSCLFVGGAGIALVSAGCLSTSGSAAAPMA